MEYVYEKLCGESCLKKHCTEYNMIILVVLSLLNILRSTDQNKN